MEPFYVIFAILFSNIYLLPTICAWNRRHRNDRAIFVLNLLLGWTLIGWILAMVWAWTDNVRPRQERVTPARQ